jgi:membrane associated rhomboid family serine protease
LEGLGITSPRDDDVIPPTFWSVIASNVYSIAGALLYGAALAAVVVYQWHEHDYLQAIGAAILAGLLGYYLFDVLRRAAARRDTPARWRVDGWTPPRSWATIGLVVFCVLTTLAGWALPNHWYIDEGTVGSAGVLQRHEWWRLVTSPFLHASPMHLYFNMLALLVLGSEIDSSLGTTRFLTIYAAAALGGGLMVVATGQEKTLGASGAIYGLMGAALYFGIRALRAGHVNAARRMLVAVGALIVLNLLLTLSIPNISMAAHLGGLLAGFAVAALVGVPVRLIDAWALTDRLAGGLFSYDVNSDRFSYHGPAGVAVDAGLLNPESLAVTREPGWSSHVEVRILDPQTPIDCYVDDPYRSRKISVAVE